MCNFQFQLSSAAVTLKYGQGHSKGYDRVHFNKAYIMKCLTVTTFITSEQIATLKFLLRPVN